VKYSDLPKNRYIIRYIESIQDNKQSQMFVTDSSLLSNQANLSHIIQSNTKYLNDYFKLLDVNNDGLIGLNEINEELAKRNSQFFHTNKENIKLLFKKYAAGDEKNKIDFDVFCHFFAELNENYNEDLISKTSLNLTQVELKR